MSGRRPRRCRQLVNPIALAIDKARVLTPAERLQIRERQQRALHALAHGVARFEDWAELVTAMNVAQAIERQGVVRGLYGHMHAAELALQAIGKRCAEGITDTGQPYAVPYDAEIEVIDTALDLHVYQVSKLSRGEYQRALDAAIAEVKSTGGQVINTLQQPQAPAPHAQEALL